MPPPTTLFTCAIHVQSCTEYHQHSYTNPLPIQSFALSNPGEEFVAFRRGHCRRDPPLDVGQQLKIAHLRTCRSSIW